jgi:DNA-binding IclR family transcriptional regulator
MNHRLNQPSLSETAGWISSSPSKDDSACRMPGVGRGNLASHKTPSVRAAERVMAILEALAQSRRGFTLSGLCRQLALPKSSTYCLLLTLERRGYLRRNEHTSRYLPGLRFLSLANMPLVRIELREQAKPFLRSLMERTGLTVHMAVLEQSEAVLVEEVEPPGLLKADTCIWSRISLHGTAMGKAILAHLPSEELDRLIRKRGLPQRSMYTSTPAGELREELARVRTVGYSSDDQDNSWGSHSIASPILDHEGRVIAAISVIGTIQVTRQSLPRLAEEVKQTASAISQQLVFRPE